MARRGDEERERGVPGERVPLVLLLEGLRLAEGRAAGPLEPARHTGVRP
ncbi:MAG: hypothetical protein JRS35_26720 [Deltaproteobacteria bacterium]|nr:hypothetical protein [Deltaproteobacteria bacterium]